VWEKLASLHQMISSWLPSSDFVLLQNILMVSQINGKIKSSSSPAKVRGIKRRRELHEMRCIYVRLSRHEMKRNAEIGLFTKPSDFEAAFVLNVNRQSLFNGLFPKFDRRD